MDAVPHDTAAGMERLVAVVQQLSQAREMAAIMRIVREAARDLTGADGATFVLREGDQCHYADENAISPLWKGKRFPLDRCVSGWVMLERRAAVIEDIYADPRVPADAYRPTFVKSLAMVPIRRAAPIGAIGNYWARRRRPTDGEVALLQALADTTSVALENAQLYAELAATIETLRERQARVLQQRDALEVFARVLAHDLREPVRTIRSFSGALAGAEPAGGPDGEMLRHIQAAGERMAALIDAVGEYVQLDDPQRVPRETVRMGEVAEAALSNLAALIRERGARVTVDALPVVTASRTQMLQVLQNLVSNALGHGGRGVAVHVGARREGPAWTVTVRDDGPGIAAEHHTRIFEPFKRLARDDAHSGLGLAICRRIVEAHGGRIGCRSEPGRGATFAFTLPAEAPPAATSAAPPAATPALPPAEPRAPASAPAEPAGVLGQASTVPAPATVLLVDDREADILMTRIRLFGSKGLACRVVVARDGGEALRLVEDARRQGSAIDFVLLDINMPGMDGFETLERIRDDPGLRDLPVVMHTGSTYRQDKERADALGAAGYLEKPADVERLLPIIERLSGVRVVETGGKRALVRHALPVG
jgi:two-component system CheB/CheR fusion protein